MHYIALACVLRCVQLCNTMDCNPPDLSVHGVFQTEILWSELPFPPPVGLPDPGIKPVSLASPVLAGGFFTAAPAGKPK